MENRDLEIRQLAGHNSRPVKLGWNIAIWKLSLAIWWATIAGSVNARTILELQVGDCATSAPGSDICSDLSSRFLPSVQLFVFTLFPRDSLRSSILHSIITSTRLLTIDVLPSKVLQEPQASQKGIPYMVLYSIRSHGWVRY